MQSNEPLSIKIGQTVQKLGQNQFVEAKLTSTRDEISRHVNNKQHTHTLKNNQPDKTDYSYKKLILLQIISSLLKNNCLFFLLPLQRKNLCVFPAHNCPSFPALSLNTIATHSNSSNTLYRKW